MNCLKFNLLCKSLSNVAVNRKFQTYSILLATKRKKFNTSEDLGIRHMKKTFQDDPEFEEQLNAENDVIGYDDFDDFGTLDPNYRESKRNKSWERQLVARKIIKRKFFSPGPQPRMLSSAEKQCIKYLHRKDPQQWTINVLAENFPATPDMIHKLLKSKKDPSPQRKKEMDLEVQENWKLLEENKLDGDPEYLNHCSQFLSKRKTFIDQIKNQNFDITEIAEEKVYNCGEMSNILVKYEKEIEDLLFLDKFLSNNEKGVQNVTPTENKTSLELMHEKVNEEKEIIDLEGKDSFKLKMDTKSSRKQLTFDEMRKNILKKAEKKQDLSIIEKAILEAGFSLDSHERMQSDSTTKNNQLNNKISKENKFNSFKTNDNDVNFLRKSSFKGKNLPKENILSEEQPEDNPMDKNILNAEELGKVFKFNENSLTFQVGKKKNKKKDLKTDESISAPKDCLHENKTNNDYDINKDNHKSEAEYSLLKAGNTVNTESNQAFEATKELEEADSKNRIKFEKSENKEDVNFSDDMLERAIMEARDSAPEIRPKVSHLPDYKNQKKVEFEDYYPERINIPAEKRKLGSLFKVRDCYYDYDGRFLYKVPGMTK